MQTDLTGQLLIAMPSIGDDRFSRSVILVCAHAEHYAMGLVLNKPMDRLTLPSLLTQLDVEAPARLAGQIVLDGGPVGPDRGFVLHSEDFCCTDATMDVAEGVCMTATREALHAIASESPPDRAVMALGYSGWGPGQLEFELSENAWLIGPPDHQILFGDDHAEKWSRALELIGVESGRLQSGSGRA
ncbi:MAG: YqgE/AlgH family protein [Pseudomonadota bacterium]